MRKEGPARNRVGRPVRASAGHGPTQCGRRRFRDPEPEGRNRCIGERATQGRAVGPLR